MKYDYKCEACGKREERSVMSADRDYQVCGYNFCKGKMVRQCHYSTIAIEPSGAAGTFHVPAHELLDPDSYPGKRARLDQMNGYANSSEFDEWGERIK